MGRNVQASCLALYPYHLSLSTPFLPPTPIHLHCSLILPPHAPPHFLPVEEQDACLRAPLGDLSLPVGQHRHRRQDQNTLDPEVEQIFVW
jgi:hypothetical protein